MTQTGADVHITPSAVDMPSGSDIVQFTVAALVSTHWSVTPHKPWITIVDSGSGFGDSAVTLAIGANPSYLLRTGTVAVGSAELTIRQAGLTSTSIDITPRSSTVDPGGALGSIAVSATPDSPWQVQSQTPWVLIAGATNGSGNGNVNLVISANPTVSTRTGNIVVAGVAPNLPITHVVTQGALPVLLLPTNSIVPASGAVTNLSLIVGDSVSWTASVGASWLARLSASSGIGPATVQVQAAANTSVYTRVGAVLAGGKTASITQTGRWATVSTNNVVLPPDGGAVYFDVHVEGGAYWAATPESPWLTVALGASGTGNGSVMVVADPYSEYSRARIGSLLIAGQKVFVSQRGYSLTIYPSAAQIGSNAGAGQLAITAPLNAVWDAVVSEPWITIVGDSYGVGSGVLHYTVTENTSGALRTGRIIISGEEYIIQQGVNPTDNDEDGVPNAWEILYGFDIEWPGDAGLDGDHDGLSNLREYELGTHPLNPDTDGDGVPDGTEHALAGLGFNVTSNSAALAAMIQQEGPGLGLYTSNQIHDLAFGGLVLARDPTNGTFMLMLQVEHSANMGTWTNLAPPSLNAHLQPDGTIEAEIATSDSNAFYRVKASNGQ